MVSITNYKNGKYFIEQTNKKLSIKDSFYLTNNSNYLSRIASNSLKTSSANLSKS